jgi:ribosomal-protein-alanine N-acetyltransferase
LPVKADLIIERGGNVTIVAANSSLLDAAEAGGTALADALGAAPPASWPPLYNGPEVFAWVRDMMGRHPEAPGWFTWFIIGDGQLCGTGGYKGPPAIDGSVEIGYSVIPECQRRGFASSTVNLLVARAFRDERVRTVRAETLTDGIATQGVLRRCGFSAAGSYIDPEEGEILRFERRRS